MNIMLTDFWNVVNSSGGAEKVLCRMANELVDRALMGGVVSQSSVA